MKKKEVKKNKGNSFEERNDLKSLNSELGSFGLEPPKIYRKDQKINNYPNDSKSKRKQIVPKTIQQQRQEENKKRKKKKLRRKLILYMLLVLGISAVIIILSLTVLFKIETITIKGNEIYTVKEISAVLPIEKEKNLFLADISSAKEKLEENLPYIYDANIKRKLPSTIIVNITETPKIYCIKNKDKTYTLLDDNFKVLEASAQSKPKNSVVIKKAALSAAVQGKKAEFTNKKTMDSLEELSTAIKRLELDKATGIYSADINNNCIVYDSRITIKLGTLDDIDNKLFSALSAIEKLEKANPNAEGEITANGDKRIYFTEK